MEIIQTEIFSRWYNGLKDIVVIAAIRKRIDRIEKVNNFEDYSKISGEKGLFEFRIHIGKGYRVYYIIEKNTVVLLLCGGIKDEQRKDILKAIEIIKNLQRGHQ
ncbi:MAG: type II toxin-antitoxin system RelE/ParE family toxin [Endomicrobium sp.]|nr:type II toxin-antitoxin system RelE/ParE family toxin [Endomicrobium sp.]